MRSESGTYGPGKYELSRKWRKFWVNRIGQDFFSQFFWGSMGRSALIAMVTFIPVLASILSFVNTDIAFSVAIFYY